MEPVSQIEQQRQLLNDQEMKALEDAINKRELPTLTMKEPMRFWEYEDWVYVFATTKVLWKKLRIFALQRLIRHTVPGSNLLIVEDPGLHPEKMSLMLVREREDLTIVEEQFKREVANRRFTMEVQLPKTQTINMALYDSRVKHYQELKKQISKQLGTDQVVTNKLWTRGTLRIYQLKLVVNLLNDQYFVRVIENNDLYLLEICTVAANDLRPPLECFPLLDDVNALMRKISTVSTLQNFPNRFSMQFGEKFKLSEALMPQNYKPRGMPLRCWVNEAQGLTIVAEADLTTFEIWISLTHEYRKNVHKVEMRFNYCKEGFQNEFATLLDRIRHLEEPDYLDPYFLFESVGSLKKTIKKETIVWDIRQNQWHLFTLIILEFPIPISISVQYNFTTERLYVSSLLMHGEGKHMQNIAEAMGQGLAQLSSEWESTSKPEELARCKRIECPAHTIEEIKEHMLPEMKRYDVVMVNRGVYYDTALYMSKGYILSMKPMGNYKQLQPEEHLIAHGFAQFAANTQIIVLRDQQFTEAQEAEVNKRLNTMDKKFIYYGFANDSDEVMLRARFGTEGSLSTAFFFILLRYLMGRNLMEKELIDYIQGLVLARTDAARLAFIKEYHHSVRKAVDRVKSTCSPQMRQILERFDWLFDAFAE